MARMNIERYLKKANAKEIKERIWDFPDVESFMTVQNIDVADIELYSNAYTTYKVKNEGSEEKRAGYNRTFFFCETRKETLELARKGWTDGANKMNERIKNLKLGLSSKTSMRPKYDVVGFQASVPRYLQGIPASMVNRKPVQKKEKIINVYKTFGYNGFYSSDQIVEHSAKAIAIVQILENSGYRVNLYAAKYNEDSEDGQTFGCRVKLKDAQQPLNLKKVAFYLSNTDFQRRLLWRLMELHPDYAHPMSGYGRPVENEFGSIHTKEELEDYKEKYGKLFKLENNDMILPITIDGDVQDFLKNFNFR